MAQRLATEYVHASLKLTLAQLMQLIEMFSHTSSEIHAKVLDNGSQHIYLNDHHSQLMLHFQFDNGFYFADGSYRFLNADWTNVMRQAIRAFKGDAVVHRIYEGFTMIYRYEKGHVTKIVESSMQAEKVIYEYKDTIGSLEQLFRRQTVEEEIMRLRELINKLLDKRNHAECQGDAQKIDERLQSVVHKLFVLEA
jgi:hypothetical protein